MLPSISVRRVQLPRWAEEVRHIVLGSGVPIGAPKTPVAPPPPLASAPPLGVGFEVGFGATFI